MNLYVWISKFSDVVIVKREKKKIVFPFFLQFHKCQTKIMIQISKHIKRPICFFMIYQSKIKKEKRNTRFGSEGFLEPSKMATKRIGSFCGEAQTLRFPEQNGE